MIIINKFISLLYPPILSLLFLTPSQIQQLGENGTSRNKYSIYSPMLEPAEEISDTQIGKLTVKTVCHFYVAGGRLEDEMPFLNKISI